MSNIALRIGVNQIVDAIRTAFHAYVTLCLRGAPGIGKTQCSYAAGRELSRELGEEVNVVVLELGSMSEVDLRGFLIPDGEQSLFTKPPFMRELERTKHSILFLDEFLQLDNVMQKAIAPLILERRIGDHHLPPGCRVMCAGNGTQHRSGGTSLLAHVRNRMTMVDVVPNDADVTSWVAWAAQHNLESEIIAFAQLRPEQVFSADVPSDPDKAFCTPRALELTDRLAKQFPGGMRGMVESDLGLALLSGTIGHAAAVELANLVRTALSLPSYDDVVSNPRTTPVPAKLDEQYAMVMMLAMRLNTAHTSEVIEYVQRLGTNFQITWLVAVACRSEALMAHKSMGPFVTQHGRAIQPFQRYIANAVNASRKAA